jgi:hypothetical protein
MRPRELMADSLPIASVLLLLLDAELAAVGWLR